MTAPVVLGAPDAPGLYVLFSVVPALWWLAALPLALFSAARLGPFLGAVDRARSLRIRSLLVGISVALAVLLFLLAAQRVPFFGIPAVLSLAGAGILCLFGLVAEARRLGCEVRGRDPAGDSVEGGSTAVGWLVLAGIPLVPAAGPAVLLYLVLRATGTAAVAVATR